MNTLRHQILSMKEILLPLREGDCLWVRGPRLCQGAASGSGGSFWVRGLSLDQGAVSGLGWGCWLWNRGLLLDQAKTAAGVTDEVVFKEKERSLC